MLTLRNPMDRKATETPGIRTAGLLGPPPSVPATKPRQLKPAAAPAPPPPAVSRVYTVETFRAAKRSEEVVR